MFKSVKQKIRIHKIKKDALQPKAPNATMDDVQRKLAQYETVRQQSRPGGQNMGVEFL